MDENKDIENLNNVEIEKSDVENINIESQPTQPESTERRPKNNKKLIIVIFIAVVLLAAAGVLSYYFLNNKESDGKVSDKSKVVEKEKVASFTPQNAIDAVKAAVELKYPQVQPEDSDLTGDQIYYKTDDRAPSWKVPGEKFYVNYKSMGASSLEIYTANSSIDSFEASKARAAVIVESIIGSLTDNGFVKSVGDAYDYESSALNAYVKDDILCVTSSSDDSSVMNNPLYISCGNVSKYTVNLDTYKESKPFADAYLANTKTITEGTMFSFSSEKVSSTYGYRTANVGIHNAGAVFGGAMGLFYKKDGGDWKYFKATQSLLMCDDYNTVEIKAAFKGETCMVKDQADNYTEAFVQ